MTAAHGASSTEDGGNEEPQLRCHGHPPGAVTASLEHAPVAAVIVCLLDRRVVWHNREAHAVADRHGGQLLGKRVEDLSADPYRRLVREALDRIEREETGYQRVAVGCGDDGAEDDCELTCLVLDRHPDKAPHVVVYARPLPKATRWHGSYAEHLSALADPVHGSGLVALVTDDSGLVVSATEASCDLFGHTADSLLGLGLADLVEDRDTVEELLRSVRERPSRAVTAWLTPRAPSASEQPATGQQRRIAMSVLNRLAEPPLHGLLWHMLPIEDPPINAAHEGYSSEYAAFLERRLTQIGREVERAGLAVRSSGAVPARVLSGLERLSDREREVLDLLARGLRVPTIAERLFVSQSTVRNHVSALFRKFGVQSQAELIERILAPEGGDEAS